MSQYAIQVTGLGKEYKLGSVKQRYVTLRDTIMNVVTAPIKPFMPRRQGETRVPEEKFWALRNVSFEVKPGEVLGIIGKNGAGKSTLLKILSRITEPTEGRAVIHGRIGSLLEVGTGFHAELTGRENVFLNGAILGMKQAEIRQKFDEIVAFAEVERFIDTPVKYFSSGMYLRLAFAVAAHLEPEILIVDEVLAVGDLAFQRKCMGKMSEVAGQGRTVLFVSHNMAAMLRLCQTGILLRKGQVVASGEMQRVVQSYLQEGVELAGENRFDPARLTHPRAQEVQFTAVRARDCRGQITAQVNLTEGISIEVDYVVKTALRSVQIGFSLYNGDGTCVLTSTDLDADLSHYDRVVQPGRYTAACRIPPEYLRPGRYYIELSAMIPNVRRLDSMPRCLDFDVIDDGSVDGLLGQQRIGVVAPRLAWETAANGPYVVGAALYADE
jgi:lipopolysaccharide transport system ATP-binding protein